MKKCLLIEVSEDGQVSMGMATKDDAEEPDPAYQMQPAQSVDEAMQMGRDMLESDPEAEKERDEAFEGGYKEAGGGELMALMSKGKMGGM